MTPPMAAGMSTSHGTNSSSSCRAVKRWEVKEQGREGSVTAHRELEKEESPPCGGENDVGACRTGSTRHGTASHGLQACARLTAERASVSTTEPTQQSVSTTQPTQHPAHLFDLRAAREAGQGLPSRHVPPQRAHIQALARAIHTHAHTRAGDDTNIHPHRHRGRRVSNPGQTGPSWPAPHTFRPHTARPSHFPARPSPRHTWVTPFR